MKKDRENYRYEEQQNVLAYVAGKLGVVAFRPNYHGEKGDKNTVLFYTKEDAQHNREVDRQPTSYSSSEARDLSRTWKQEIDEKYVYRDAFWWFENSDLNGIFSYDYANFGKIDLRTDMAKKLEGHIRLAYAKKLRNLYLVANGGPWAICEADQYLNDLNREMLEAFSMIHSYPVIGDINYHDQKRLLVANGSAEIFESFTGTSVQNFGCSFVVPKPDTELALLIREWNRQDLPLDARIVDKITKRVEQLGGLNFVWY